MAADMKEGLTSTRKADTTHVRTGVRTYIARVCEYGGAKYERANYLRPTGGTAHTTPTREDFERFRKYLRAMVDHAEYVLDSMESHQAGDPLLADVFGMRVAAYAEDTDPDATGKVGPSGLPHICGAMASGMMAIEQARACGLLPMDPGQPWAERTRELEWTRANIGSCPGITKPATTTIDDAFGDWTHSDLADEALEAMERINMAIDDAKEKQP